MCFERKEGDAWGQETQPAPDGRVALPSVRPSVGPHLLLQVVSRLVRLSVRGAGLRVSCLPTAGCLFTCCTSEGPAMVLLLKQGWRDGAEATAQA